MGSREQGIESPPRPSQGYDAEARMLCPLRALTHGGVCVGDFDVRCHRLHPAHQYAPVGALSPRAVFLRLIAYMATVAARQLL